MFEFLSLRKPKPNAQKSQNSQTPNIKVAGGQALTAMAHELFRTLFRDALNKNGIPLNWIAVKEITTSQEGVNTLHLVLLIVKESNEDLFRLLPALQKVLDLQLNGSAASGQRSKYVFYWNFSLQATHPDSTMPEPGFWATKPSASIARLPKPPRKFDLPESEYDHRSSGFAPTQPSELS
jgi:hypothetical protein